MASQQQKSKRKRTDDTSYHDPIPPSNAYSVIHAREGQLRRTGNDVLTSLPSRSAQQSTVSWRQTASWAPVDDDATFALDPDGHLYEDIVEGDAMDEVLAQVPAAEGVRTKKRRTMVLRRPHVVWKELHRQQYLEEECRWEGRGDFISATQCPDCISRRSPTPQAAEYRCLECFLPDLSCMTCCVKRHRVNPFHRVQKWTGARFINISLKTMGLKLQLNHASLFCENPVDCHKSMLVLHTNGIHEVAIQYCNCTRAIPHHVQLLRRGLYPTSQRVIRTCASFQLLRHLHILALTTKASTYDFYRALEKSTNNIGINVPKSRYRALFRILMQWRHLKMLKRAGRGHDSAGVVGTKDGELAIACPSCPHPGINIPEGWEDAPPEIRFLYAVILCMDANFRLKNQLVSNYSQDPGLGIGWAYMIPRLPFESYVLSRMGDEDISTCVGLQALAKAYTKYHEGLRYTGVSAVSCGRSEMILPMAVGNLQKGERYANMDYTFGSALRSVGVILILISYDIACQWFVNLFKRIEEHWPEEIKPSNAAEFIPAIPKLHEPMHGKSKHQMYSLNYIPGVGNSDCECPERIWGPHNCLGGATKVQGPGTRSDTLDDNWGFWNWLKYHGLGKTLCRKFKAAVAEWNIQVEGHRGLTESLDGTLVKSWEAMCVAWENAPFPKKGKKNPYKTEATSLTETEVRKELAEEEARRLAAGGLSHHSTSASIFVTLALDLEETQRRLCRLVKVTTKDSTARKQGGLAEQRNLLRSRIRAWEQLLPIYMPGLLQYLANLNASGDGSAAPSSMRGNPEDAELWLPSRVPRAHHPAVCQPGLSEIEERLRTVQCGDALDTLRHILKIKSRMVAFKYKNMRGQRDGTRSRSVIDRVHGRARAAAAKYRAARTAKLALTGPGEWEKTYRVLLDGDIRSYQDANQLRPRTGRRGVFEDELVEASGTTARAPNAGDGDVWMFTEERIRRDGTGETRRTLSWIWTTSTAAAGPDDAEDTILQAEWAKSRARASRAKEEVQLLKEEMRRVLEYFEWKAKWWIDRGSTVDSVSKELAEGLHAYGEEQADIQRSLASHFRVLWITPLASASETPNDDDDENADDDDDENADDDDDDDDDDSDDEENGDRGQESYDPDDLDPAL